MSEIYGSANDKNAYFYASFSTSKSSITSSAVCSFTMGDIMGAFDADYEATNGQAAQVPTPRPSSCPSNITSQHILFTRKNVRMQKQVSAHALIVESDSSRRFVSIDVDFGVKNADGELFDVLFVATGQYYEIKFQDGFLLTFSNIVFPNFQMMSIC